MLAIRKFILYYFYRKSVGTKPRCPLNGPEVSTDYLEPESVIRSSRDCISQYIQIYSKCHFVDYNEIFSMSL